MPVRSTTDIPSPKLDPQTMNSSLRVVVQVAVVLCFACGHHDHARTPASVTWEDELLAASNRARERLRLLKPRFEQLQASGSKLFVKVPLPTESGADSHLVSSSSVRPRSRHASECSLSVIN